MSNRQQQAQINKVELNEALEMKQKKNISEADLDSRSESVTQQCSQFMGEKNEQQPHFNQTDKGVVQDKMYLCCLIQSKRNILSVFNINHASQKQTRESQRCQSLKCNQHSSQATFKEDSNRYQPQLSRLNKIEPLVANQMEMYYEYRENIIGSFSARFGTCRGSAEISYLHYKSILTVWENLNQQAKAESAGIDHFLKLGHLTRLAPGGWLNDVIISAYIKLLQNLITEKFNSLPFVILDSLKVEAIFDKEDHKEIERLLSKHNFDRYRSTPILIINMKKHWFFACMELGKNTNKQTVTITIFDSLAEPNINIYRRNKLMRKIIAFFDDCYSTKSQLTVCQNYPRQINGNDCGVMVLSGVKDLVLQRISWSFNSRQMNYRRALITKQLLDGQIIGI